MRLKTVVTIGITLAAAVGVALATSDVAVAAPGRPVAGDGWCDSGEACFFYNSNLAGAVYDTPHNLSIYDVQQFKCSMQAYGDGSLCSGAGRQVHNNAASVMNNNKYCDLAIYYNSNWSGSVQVVRAQTWANLNSRLKNENASHKFINC